MIKFIIYSLSLVLILSCGFQKQAGPTVDIAFSVPTNIAGKTVSGMSSISGALSSNQAAMSKSVAMSTDDSGPSDEVVMFLAILVGPNYFGIHELGENYFKEHQAEIDASQKIAVSFNNVPIGEDLVLNVTIGRVLFSPEMVATYPLGAFQFIRKTQHITVKSGGSYVIKPEAETPSPLVRMASYIGKLSNCDGSGLNCTYEPYANKVMDFMFCGELGEYLEQAMANSEESEDDSSGNEDETEDTATASENAGDNQEGTGTSTVGDAAEGPGEFFACSTCIEETEELDEHFKTDGLGKVSTEIFAGEALKLFIVNEDGSWGDQVLGCDDVIPSPLTGAPFVYTKHLIDGTSITTSALIAKLTTTERDRLFPGYGSSDLDQDGISDTTEVTQLYSSPFEVDAYYGTHFQNTLYASYADVDASKIRIFSGFDTNEISLSQNDFNQFAKFSECFSAEKIGGANKDSFSAVSATTGQLANDWQFWIKDNGSYTNSYYLYKIKFGPNEGSISQAICSAGTDLSSCEGANPNCLWRTDTNQCVDPCSAFLNTTRTGYKHVYVASSSTSATASIGSVAGVPGGVIEPDSDLSGTTSAQTATCNNISAQASCTTPCAWESGLDKCFNTDLYASGWSIEPGLYKLTMKASSNQFMPSADVAFISSSWQHDFIHTWDKEYTDMGNGTSYLTIRFFLSPWYDQPITDLQVYVKNAVNDTGTYMSGSITANVHSSPFLSHMYSQEFESGNYLMLYTMGTTSDLSAIQVNTNYGSVSFSKADSYFAGFYGDNATTCGSFGNFYDVKHVEFVDANYGYAIVKGIAAPYANKFLLYKTLNGGMTWMLLHEFTSAETEDIQEFKVIEDAGDHHIWALSWKNAAGYQIYYSDGTVGTPTNIYTNGNSANVWAWDITKYAPGLFTIWTMQHNGSYSQLLHYYDFDPASPSINYSAPAGSINFGSHGTPISSNITSIAAKYNSSNGKYCFAGTSETGQAVHITSMTGGGAEDLTVSNWTVTNGLTSDASGVKFYSTVIDLCNNTEMTAYASGEKNLFYEFDGANWNLLDGCASGNHTGYGSSNVFDCGVNAQTITEMDIHESTGEILATSSLDCTAASSTCSAPSDESSCWSASPCCQWDFQASNCSVRSNYITKIGFYSPFFDEWFHVNEMDGQSNDIDFDPASRSSFHLAVNEFINNWYWDNQTSCNNVALYHLGEVGYEQLPKPFWGEGEGKFISNSSLACGSYSVTSISYYDNASSLIKTVTPAFGSSDFEKDALARNSNFETCQNTNHSNSDEPVFNASTVSVTSTAYGKATIGWAQAANCQVIENFSVYAVEKVSGYATAAEFSFLSVFEWADWSVQDRGCQTSMDVNGLDPNKDYSFIVRAHYWGETDGNVVVHQFDGASMPANILVENFEGLDTGQMYYYNDPYSYNTNLGNKMWTSGNQFSLTASGSTYAHTVSSNQHELYYIMNDAISTGKVTVQLDFFYAATHSTNVSTNIMSIAALDSSWTNTAAAILSTGATTGDGDDSILVYENSVPNIQGVTPGSMVGGWHTLKLTIDLDADSAIVYIDGSSTPSISIPAGYNVSIFQFVATNDSEFRIDNLKVCVGAICI